MACRCVPLARPVWSSWARFATPMVRERGPDDPRRPIGNDQQQIAEPSGAQILEERAHGVDINKRRRPLSAAGGCGYCNRRGR